MAKDVIDDRYKSLEGELQKIVASQLSHAMRDSFAMGKKCHIRGGAKRWPRGGERRY